MCFPEKAVITNWLNLCVTADLWDEWNTKKYLPSELSDLLIKLVVSILRHMCECCSVKL